MKIILSIGANIGNIKENFCTAISKLSKNGISIIKISKIYCNPPLGCPPDTPDFYNFALSGFYNETPNKLYEVCKSIEIQSGRPEKHQKWTSRTLDIDIAFFGSLCFSDHILTIPHKEALKRLFVLIPAAEIEPDFIIPNTNFSLNQFLQINFSKKKIENFKKNSFQLDFLY